MDDKCRLAPKKPPPPTPNDTDNSCAPRLPPKPMREQAKVLFAYEAQNDDELSIREGDVITIISKEIEDLGWWKGELNGSIGVFPDNFVELIKPTPVAANDELTLPPRLKKPERPPTSEKPVNSCVPSKLCVNSSSTTTTATIVDGHPALSAKKPKAPAGPLKPVTKPDVVPHEAERDWKETATENGKSELESKLKHLTAERAKGPPNRRLPTFPKKSNDDDSPDGVDGDEKKLEQQKSSPDNGEEQNPPFVSELQNKLRKRSDEKRGTYSDSSLLIKITPKSPDGRTPPETTAKPNLDVVNKRHSYNPSLATEITNNNSGGSATTGSSSTKLSNSLPNSSPVANAMQRETNNSSSSSSSSACGSGDNSALFKLKQLQAVVDDQREEINELKKEVKKLKEECFSRKEFEELIRAAETHVQQQITAYSSYIRTAVFQKQNKD